MPDFKLDTHVHTREVSFCGRLKARKITSLYRDRGYDGVIITDHYTPEFLARFRFLPWPAVIGRFLRGYRLAAETGASAGLLVLPAMEIRFGKAPEDYLVYGLDESFLLRNRGLCELGLERFSALAHAHGALIYQAHPFRRGLHPAAAPWVDGFEVYNGNPRQDSRNGLAFQRAVAQGLLMLSGSDAHQKEDIGRGGIVLPGAIEDCGHLLEYLRSGRSPILIQEGVPVSIDREKPEVFI